MPIRFPYDLPELAQIQAAAIRLRDIFPLISIAVTDRALELSSIPSGKEATVMHMAALQLMLVRTGDLNAQSCDALPELARVA